MYADRRNTRVSCWWPVLLLLLVFPLCMTSLWSLPASMGNLPRCTFRHLEWRGTCIRRHGVCYVSRHRCPACADRLASRSAETDGSSPVSIFQPSGWFFARSHRPAVRRSLLFPLDAIARRLSLSNPRRALATLLEAVLIFPVSPFGVIPKTHCHWPSVFMRSSRHTIEGGFTPERSSRFLVVFQPLILLIVPLALAYVPVKKWPASAQR